MRQNIFVLAMHLALIAGAAFAEAPRADSEARPMPMMNVAAPMVQVNPQPMALQLTLPPTVVPVVANVGLCDEVGYIAQAPQNVVAAPRAAQWVETAAGQHLSRIELSSANAVGLRVQLTDIGDMELRVYDPATFVGFGPYISPTLAADGTWWSTVIFGDSIGLEFTVPAGLPIPPVLPDLTAIAYLYRGLGAGAGEVAGGGPPPGTCDPDITCYASWSGSVEDQAVAYLLFNCGPTSCGQCTGAMLNRSPSEVGTGYVSPTLMTARHCVGDQATANSLIAFWNFNSTTCNGTTLAAQTRNDGSLLLKTTFDSEWSLLGLYQPDQTGSYLGWDAGYLSNGSSTTGIHHGAGQSKRICFGSKTGDSSCLGASNEWFVQYTIGRTIPGASGSPVLDISRRVRGTLSCDNRMCPPSQASWYGRLDTAFAWVGTYLFGLPNPTFVNDAVAGDPGNDGTSESGTAGNPFNTVYEGSFCVPTNGEVQIAPGNYNEQFRLWRPMTLRRSGSSGVVTIGRP